MLADRTVSGERLRQTLTRVTDAALAALFGDAPGCALVALGGYGRRDPAPGSDLDLVLVHAGGRLSGSVDRLAERIWYPIWDSGVGLDHAVRTVREALAVAADDLTAALGLLDARHIAGDPALTGELVTAVHEVWRRQAPRRLPELVTAVRDRAERAGELAFLLEPDLKDSAGGLRDVHAMHAVAAAWVSDPPGAQVRAAYARLLDVRGELHRTSGRPTDRLVFEEHEPVARALGLSDADELLRAVSEAGRTIGYAAEQTCRRVQGWAAGRRWRRDAGRPRQRVPLADGVVEQDGVVVLARDADPGADPGLVLRAAAAAATSGCPLADHTLERLVREGSDPPEPWPAAAREALFALLGAGPGSRPVLEALDQAGLLARLLPEWTGVRFRRQHNPVHRFTVDRHLIETAVEATRFSHAVPRPDLLGFAAFLHDLGKAWPGRHAETGAEAARVISRRIGLGEPEVETVALLVRHHLLLPDTATRRDLDDPETVAAVAAAVGDAGTLAMLHALTEADARATGPAAWTEWKAGLVGELVRRTAATLSGAPVPPPPGPTPLARSLAARHEIAVVVEPGRPTFTVTVAAPDRPGTLARAAGVLALHRLNVRSASAGSIEEMAVTSFEVEPRYGEPPPQDRLTADLRRVLSGGLPVDEQLAARERAYPPPPGPTLPVEVTVVDGASQTATVVEVRARDAAGLLYRLTSAIARCGVDVRAARVSTFGVEAVDAFYLVEPGGGPLSSPSRRHEVVQAMRAAAAGAAGD